MDSKHILLVDDDSIGAALLMKFLKEEGYTVSYASSGEEALEFCRAGMDSIDMILMDIDLGSEMDGVVVAQQVLKRINPSPTVTTHRVWEVCWQGGKA